MDKTYLEYFRQHMEAIFKTNFQLIKALYKPMTTKKTVESIKLDLEKEFWQGGLFDFIVNDEKISYQTMNVLTDFIQSQYQQLVEECLGEKKSVGELFPKVKKEPTEEFAFCCATKDGYNQAITEIREALKQRGLLK
jgi:hypothetical protein